MGVERTRKKANKSEFETVWPGVKRCLECGYCIATDEIDEGDSEKVIKMKKEGYKKEKSSHSTYHGKFYKARSEYGDANVLTYKDLRTMSEDILSRLKQLKDNDVVTDLSELPMCFEKAEDIVSDLMNWSASFEESTSHYLQEDFSLFTSVSKAIRETIKEYEGENGTNLITGLSQITQYYYKIFDRIQAILVARSSATIHDYDDVELPYFATDLKEAISVNENYLQVIPSKGTKTLAILHDFFRIEFTKSLRLWDMCKSHPSIEDYGILLWNTPKFRNYIKGFLTDRQYSQYLLQNLANRQLNDSKFEEAPYYFGSVSETEYSKDGVKQVDINGKKYTILTDKNGKYIEDEKGVKYSIKDISYMDSLTFVADDNDDDDADLEDLQNVDEIESFASALSSISQLSTVGTSPRRRKVK